MVTVALTAGIVGCGDGAPSQYQLTMVVDPEVGGTADDLTNASPYAEGTEVSIRAAAAAGYQFAGWTGPAGTFADPSAAETTFSMPAQDVTVTGNFHLLASPARELPDQVTAGEEFEVTVIFSSPHDGFHAIGLTDVVPEGWSVSVDANWATPQAMTTHVPELEEVVYIWGGPYDVGVTFTVLYKAQVPADAEPGTYSFGGFLEYFIQPHPSPSYVEDITGDMQVTVG